MESQHYRHHLLENLQRNAEKAGETGEAGLGAAPAAVGFFHLIADSIALIQETVRVTKGAQYIKARQQILQFADTFRFGGGAGFAQTFHPFLEQLWHHQHHRRRNQSRYQHEPMQGNQGQNTPNDQSCLLDTAKNGCPSQMFDLLDISGQPRDVFSGILAVIDCVGLIQQGQVQIVAHLVVHRPNGSRFQNALNCRQSEVEHITSYLHCRPKQELSEIQVNCRVKGLHHDKL